MRGFGENLADWNGRQRDGDEGEFIGPNPPGGSRTNKRFMDIETAMAK